MNRRDFLKNSLTVAALAPLAKFANQTGLAAEVKSEEKKDDKNAATGAKVKITTRKYKDTAQEISLLGFGCMRFPQKGGKVDIDAVKAMFKAAFAAGINYFDTAYVYNGSEAALKEVLKDYPRSSFNLTNKLPLWSINTEADVERVFKEELDRCGVDYFDFYLLHNLNVRDLDKAKRLKVFEFLERMKKEGKIKKLGFSSHGQPQDLQTIVNSYDKWEFAQIQLNYMDWVDQKAKEQYEILTEKKIPVVIMEPIRGGRLANLPENAMAILKKNNPDASAASWALRFAASLPNVLTVLSGMSNLQQVEENIRTFSPFKELTEQERKVLNNAYLTMRNIEIVPCTACRYCMPCPAGVNIPGVFAAYNKYKEAAAQGGGANRGGANRPGGRMGGRNNAAAAPAGNVEILTKELDALKKSELPSSCVKCDACKPKCPQSIDIPTQLAMINKLYKK